MSKFRHIRDPNRPSSPVPPIPKSVNEGRRQYLGSYTVAEPLAEPGTGSCYIVIRVPVEATEIHASPGALEK